MDDPVDRLAKTLLYEGYLLYPYRPTAVKNQQRFNFGVLYPETCCQGEDRWHLQAQCPVEGTAETSLSVRVQFLQLVARAHGRETRQEAIERQVVIDRTTIGRLCDSAREVRFAFACGDADTGVLGASAFGEQIIHGVVEVEALECDESAYIFSARVRNLTQADDLAIDRDQALLRSLVSVHLVIEAHDGNFVSVLDPPDARREVVARCTNDGVWPVLVGAPERRNQMLASPIILYDYPTLAPESEGDLFDGTEIDEILSLRILTLTDEEKREVREGDERARRILERTENMPPEQWAKLHGAVRGLRRVAGGAQ